MSHIELRDPDGAGGMPAPAVGDALADFLSGMAGEAQATRWVVTDDGRPIGAAAVFTADGEREATYLLNDPDPDTAAETLRLLGSREPERPLYARLPVDDEASAAMLARLGFTELSRTDVELRVILPPTLE